ncbi:MAG: hypothetical protein MZU84_08285 [Sphingobacterium sp.]|nr:hypothetical protein [Sphingobacterium sp.]
MAFVYNGGPGSASVWLHMGAFGPRKVVLADDGNALPGPPGRLIDNEFTLLDTTDLCFIDPVGTGYSRPVPGENPAQFYGYVEDVAAVGDFIRLFVTRYERWASPKFLIGESYGTPRSAGLAGYLQGRSASLYLNGIVLISAILNFQTARFAPMNDAAYMLFLPTYTADAWYHKKLPADLQAKELAAVLAESRAFALEEYALALLKGNTLEPAARDAVVRKVARFTGLSTDFVANSNLRIPLNRFVKELLRGERRTDRPARRPLQGLRSRRRRRDLRVRSGQRRHQRSIPGRPQRLCPGRAQVQERHALRRVGRRPALELRQRREPVSQHGRDPARGHGRQPVPQGLRGQRLLRRRDAVLRHRIHLLPDRPRRRPRIPGQNGLLRGRPHDVHPQAVPREAQGRPGRVHPGRVGSQIGRNAMNKNFKIAGLLAIAALLAAVPSLAAADKPLLAQHPSLSRTQIVFAYAGDLWLTGRDGGPAARLTTGVGIESDPAFSPDGSLVAFSGQYDGNTDVFVVAAAGGVPRRLTHHPQPDNVVGWTPDGKRVLFSSARTNANGIPMLFTVDTDGGMPEALPLPTGVSGSYSADGSRLAYVPTQLWQAAWKRYQGGQTTPIWIVSLSDLAVEKIPRENSNDSNPLWIGDRIYFLSDRNGAISLFVYDLATKKVAEALPNDGLDFKSASAGPGGIVIEQFGALHLFDPATGTARRISVSLEGDLAEVRPHFAKVGSRIASASISPNGARAVFEARGEILTVPAEKGDIRNLTRTTGVMERDPSWSPGRQVRRLFLRRIGRVRPAHPRPGRAGTGQEDRPRRTAVLLLLARLVARRQEDRLSRQAPDGLVRRYRQGYPGQGRFDLLLQSDAHLRHRLVAGQPLADLRASSSRATWASSASTRSRRARQRRSPTA